MHWHSQTLGITDYLPVWKRMTDWVTQARQQLKQNQIVTPQLWFTQHHPVFTQGRHGDPSHLLHHSQIPVIQTDRGGQITYHGPGQWVLYPLLHLKSHHLGVRQWVRLLEQSVIQTLADFHVNAQRLDGQPGVYVAGKKIASLGIRVHHGFSYHGVALNAHMDLSPFQQINPCGLSAMTMTMLSQCSPSFFQQIQTDQTHAMQTLLEHWQIHLMALTHRQ